MQEHVLCKICGERRARRACPAVHGDICTLCCGLEREVSLSCPLECEYLQEAHKREKAIAVAGELPNADIKVTEEFLHSREAFLLFSAYALLEAALQTSGAVDSDVVAALEALIQTHRTLESGLVYETRPSNLVAAAVQDAFNTSMEDYQKLRREREGLAPVRNVEILAILVFLHRIAQLNQNGRPKGRMYIDLLHRMSPRPRVEEPPSSILL